MFAVFLLGRQYCETWKYHVATYDYKTTHSLELWNWNSSVASLELVVSWAVYMWEDVVCGCGPLGLPTRRGICPPLCQEGHGILSLERDLPGIIWRLESFKRFDCGTQWLILRSCYLPLILSLCY